MAKFGNIYLAHKAAAFIENWDIIIAARTKGMNELPHFHIRSNRGKITVNNLIHCHQRKDRLVCVMRD